MAVTPGYPYSPDHPFFFRIFIGISVFALIFHDQDASVIKPANEVRIEPVS
jgi:hypothetical protein